MAEVIGHTISNEEALDLRNTDGVIVNSAKDIKFYYLWVYLQTMARGSQAESLIDGDEVLTRSASCPQVNQYHEPMFERAIESSDHKAEYLNTWFPEIMTSGADSIFKAFNQKTSKWDTYHKLGREKNPASKIPRFYRELRERYVSPKSKQLFFNWELSATFKNGKDHHFPELLVVKTKALDQDLYNRYFDHAIRSGLIYKSSTGIALIEAVMENDPNTQIGFFTPRKMEDLGVDIWKNLVAVDEYTKNLTVQSVLSTVPLGTYLNDRHGSIFEKAFEVSQNAGLIKENETI